MPHLGVDAWGSYDEHGNVAPKPQTEDEQRAANERAQIQEVFGLTGGELMDVAWGASYPNDGASMPIVFTYWYQGVPEYVEREFDALPFDYAPTYRTVCEQELYGMVPERIMDDEGTWTVVKRYSTSGECDCPLRYAPDGASIAKVTGEHDCPLCEESLGEEHGYIYIGDGWSEIVYRLQKPPEVHGELAIQEHVSERGQRYVDTGIPETTFTIEADATERGRALRLSCDAGQLGITLPRYAVNEMTRPSHEAASFWLRVWEVLYDADTTANTKSPIEL